MANLRKVCRFPGSRNVEWCSHGLDFAHLWTIGGTCKFTAIITDRKSFRSSGKKIQFYLSYMHTRHNCSSVVLIYVKPTYPLVLSNNSPTPQSGFSESKACENVDSHSGRVVSIKRYMVL